ncbi:MAG: filamentous hemagglutinin N-terminal domain-containing protein [Sedimentisphaerales bacterium]|nr:filamentous hemagglutinin N-terminal domain-containing protein [Sedimentisphaerales bacterium]
MKGFKAFLKSHFVREVTIYFLVFSLVFTLGPSTILATPTGGVFTEGTGTIVDGVTDSTVMVDQSRSIIEWDSMNTGSAESLTFSQQEGLSNSAVLNRVISGSVTQFDGTLNGVDMRIFVVNPAGVIFGDGAVINVNQLVASSLMMSDSDFANAVGNPTESMVFSGGNGNVTVEGILDATNSGSIYLVGKNVTNNGAILCPDGLVVMVAGDTVRLGQPGSSAIVDMGDITANLVADSDNVVNNNGTVGESGSSVEKLVLAAGDVFSQAIANVDNVTVIARDDVGLSDVTATGDVEVYSGLGGAADSDINVNGSITAGSIKLQASTPDTDFRRLYNINVSGDLHSTEGDIDISAREHIAVNGDITADNGSIYATGDADNRGRGNLSLGNLEAQNGDIELKGRAVAVEGGAVAGGDMTIMGMKDKGFEGGGTVSAGNLEAGGSIDISIRESLIDNSIDGDGQITLAGDVVAGRDIILNNNTDMTASGAVIEAGEDVVLANDGFPAGYDGACEELTGNHELTITAGAADGVDDGRIYAQNTTISVLGSSMTLQQDADLNLDDFSFANQGNTDLTANSANGSVTITEDGSKPENAADRWASVGATAYGDITLSGNSGDITTKQLTAETGDIEVNAKGGALVATESIEAMLGSLNLTGDAGIYASGDLTAGTDVRLNSDTSAADGVIISAGQDAIVGNGTGDGTSLTAAGELVVEAGRDIVLGGDVDTAGDLVLAADTDAAGGGDVTAFGSLTSAAGSISVSASDSTIYLYDNVDAAIDLLLNNNTWAADSVELSAGQDVIVGDGTGDGTSLAGAGDLAVAAGRDILLGGDVDTAGDLILTADTGDVTAFGSLTSDGGSVSVSSSDSTYLYGNISALHDVTVNSDLTLTAGEWVLNGGQWSWENGDQSIVASEGTVTAKGEVWKETPGQLNIYGGSPDLAVDLQNPGELSDKSAAVATAGNLYIYGNGDVQIAGDVTAIGGSLWGLPDLPEESEAPVNEMGVGGVSIISDNGKIYTADGGDNDALGVTIEAYSDQVEGLGVDLPGAQVDKKAAIVLMSKENLNLGEGSELYAYGQYHEVDDRAAVNLLDVPETIGGSLRDEGEPIDIAVYLASTGTDSADGQGGQGNINLALDSVIVGQQGTVVVDAYDTITFSDAGDSAGECDIDRLEVVSRITEWLADAAGRLPYAGDQTEIDSLEEEIGGDYVLRGAGLENTEITDGRAWVLENEYIAPIVEAAPLPLNVEVGVSGCPALIQWTAQELGIESEDIQIWITNTLASLKDIQPCDACSRLKAAVTILMDVDGTHIAALTQVIDEFASSDAPVSEEQMASIADAIANNTEADNAYAVAGEYLDALTTYITVVSSLGLSTEDAITFATDKYIAPLIDTGNASLATYLTARMTAIGQ